jgi:hypothetical protein
MRLELIACLGATLVLGGMGCGGASPDVRGASVRPSVTIPIYTADEAGRPARSPLIDVMLADVPTRLVLDSGATHHYITGATAWIRGIGSIETRGYFLDSAGRSVPVRWADRGVLRIGEHVVPDVTVIETSTLVAHGIAGGVSPQVLAPEGYASRIDLRRGSLEIVPDDTLLPSERSMDGRACGVRFGGGAQYVLDVEVGGLRVAMLADTGSTESWLFEGTPAAESLRASGAEATSTTRSVIAGTVEVLLYRDVPVRVGGALISSAMGVSPLPRTQPEDCPSSGGLGFDVLKHCRLTLRDDGPSVLCGAAAAELRQAPPAPPLVTTGPFVVAGLEATAGCGFSAEGLTPEPPPGGFPSYPTDAAAYAELAPTIDEMRRTILWHCREDRSYPDADLVAPILRRNGTELRVVFEVREGPRRLVRALRVELAVRGGESVEVDAASTSWIRTRPGAIYNGRELHEDEDDIRAALAAQGFRVVSTSWDRTPVGDDSLDLRLAIELDRADALGPPTLPEHPPARAPVDDADDD